jgi:protein-S-isoprenylcysteine O-methyltransferase Ste14
MVLSSPEAATLHPFRSMNEAIIIFPQPRIMPRGKGMIEKLRKPISLFVAILLIALLVFVQPRGFGTLRMELVKLAGFALVFAGVLGRILCTVYIGGRKNRELCQSGIYSMCRNPLYFFSFLGLIGIFLVSQHITITLVAGSLFLILYHNVILSEEKKLLALFPQEFPTYEKTVPRFWPRWGSLKDSRILEVNTGIFIRSLSEVLWFLFALIAIEAIGIMREHGVIAPFFSWF